MRITISSVFNISTVFFLVYIAVSRNAHASSISNTNNIAKTISQDPKVYPNPCYNFTQLHFTSNGKIVKIEIYDAHGSQIQTVLEKQLRAQDQEITIDTSILEPGIYFIFLKQGESLDILRFIRK